MKKQNIAEEVIDCCIEQDFNPDIVLDGVRETYEVGLREGFFKGFTVGFGLWFVSLSTIAIAIKIANKRKKNEKEPLVIDIDDPKDPKKGIHKYLYKEEV